MVQDNLTLIRGMYEALGKGDVVAFTQALHPDIHWIVAPGFPLAEGNPWVGQGGVGRLFMGLMAEWKRFKIVPTEFYAAGDDTVIALGEYSAICRATGKPVVAQFAHVGQLRDGKVIRYRQFADTVQFARALEP